MKYYTIENTTVSESISQLTILMNNFKSTLTLPNTGINDIVKNFELFVNSKRCIFTSIFHELNQVESDIISFSFKHNDFNFKLFKDKKIDKSRHHTIITEVNLKDDTTVDVIIWSSNAETQQIIYNDLKIEQLSYKINQKCQKLKGDEIYE